MCQALMELFKDEVEEREDKAADLAVGNNIKNLMSSINLSADQAMDALKIPQEKRQVYYVYLNQ